MTNPDVSLNLDEAVAEVLGLLTGLELTYAPELDRYRSVTRQLNRALRANALEQEWGYYASVEDVGQAVEGDASVRLRGSIRPRVINDDAVRLLDDRGRVLVWAYFLPRDALHKYRSMKGLWCATTRNDLHFSRPFTSAEEGLRIQVPVMREPRMFALPSASDAEQGRYEIPQHVREQLLDFNYPDVITLRAAFYVAQSDPVMQPRAQMLQEQYTDLMYQIMERDERNTDTPYANDFILPVVSGLRQGPSPSHRHPHSDWR